MNEVGECPRCKLMAEEWEVDVRMRRLPGPDVLDQVDELLAGLDDEANGTGPAAA